MNFVFIIDTSPSMLQKCHYNLSLLDAVKTTVEQFITLRTKNADSKFDNFFLLTTSTQKNILSSWQDDLQHFLYQLRSITFSIQNDLLKSIAKSFEILEKFRVLTSSDELCLGGRDPYKIDNGNIIILTDQHENLSGSDFDFIKEIIHWDQSIFILQFAILNIDDQKEKNQSKQSQLSVLFQNISWAFCGSYYLIDDFKQIISFVDQFQKLFLKQRFGIFIQHQDFQSQPFLPENALTIKIYNKYCYTYLQNKYDSQIKTYCKFPFPIHFNSKVQKYSSIYKIDFSKKYKVPNYEQLFEKFEIDINSQFGYYVKNLHNQQKYVKYCYLIQLNNQNIGYLKINGQQNFYLEFLLFPINFQDFFSIYQDIQENKFQMKIKERLEAYFLKSNFLQKVPNYYSQYFYQFFYANNKQILNLNIKFFQNDFLNEINNQLLYQRNEKVLEKKNLDHIIYQNKINHQSNQSICCSKQAEIKFNPYECDDQQILQYIIKQTDKKKQQIQTNERTQILKNPYIEVKYKLGK